MYPQKGSLFQSGTVAERSQNDDAINSEEKEKRKRKTFLMMMS